MSREGDGREVRIVPYSRMPGDGGYVYVLRILAQERPVKIGISNNPIQRMLALQTGIPWDIELLGTRMSWNPRELEAELHRKYAAQHMRGEWFNFSDEILEDLIKIHAFLKPAHIELPVLAAYPQPDGGDRLAVALDYAKSLIEAL